MKKTRNTFWGGVKFLSLVLALVVAFTAVNPITAEAAKKVNLPKTKAVYDIEQIKAASAEVTLGTTTLVMKPNKKIKSTRFYNGYVKFVAPETKEYKFTISDVKNKGMGYMAAYVVSAVDPTDYDYVSSLVNGKSTLNFAYKNMKNKFKDPITNKTVKSIYKKKAVGKYTLQKGQEIYLSIDNSTYGKNKNTTLKLNIK